MAKGFHTPFAKLKNLKLATPRPAAPPPPRAVPEPPPSDERLFAEEMRSVSELPPDPRGRVGVPPPIKVPRPAARDEEAEVYAALADLVEGGGHFDISATDEYVAGLADGVDRRLLRKLRAGDYAVQGHLDLHGLITEEAHVAVANFLTSARASGKRCVLLIHGRGLNSKEGIPVLKERLKVWLSGGRLGRGVLAFCSARPADGGAGALYVLLRK